MSDLHVRFRPRRCSGGKPPHYRPKLPAAALAWLPVFLMMVAAGLPLWADLASPPVRIGDNPEYLIDAWETDQGLPENSATAMVQTPEGYLWFGTFNGLVRFDGVQFTVFDPANTPELVNAAIVNLHLDSSQRMWVSTYRGLFVTEPFKWTTFRKVTAWKGDYVRTFSENTNRGILCATSFDGQVMRVQGAQMEMLPKPPGKQGAGYLGAVDGEGRTWVAELQGAFLGFWDGQAWQTSPTAAAVFPSLVMLTGLSDGRLMLVTTQEVLSVRSGNIERRLKLDKPTQTGAWSVLQDHAGNTWVSGNGLDRITPSGHVTRYSATNGLTYNSVRFAFEDREQNLWVGTSGGGLLRFKPRRFIAHGELYGVKQRNVKAVLEESPGRIMLGTYGGGLLEMQAGQFTPTTGGQKASTAYVQCLMRDRDHNLWVGGYVGSSADHPVAVLGPNGRRLVTREECGGVSVRALLQDSQGRIWIGGGVMASVYADGKFTLQNQPGTPALRDLHCFVEDPRQGDIWAAGIDGLYRYSQGAWSEIKDADGRSLEDANCLRFERDGTLWVGGVRSTLRRFRNGQWSILGQAQGLPKSRIACLLSDDSGHWWLGSSRGIVRVSEADLHQVADGLKPTLDCQVFNLSDGLASIECSIGEQSGGAKDSQGRLWFSTLKGAAVVDPQRIRLNPLPPSVIPESLSYRDHRGNHVQPDLRVPTAASPAGRTNVLGKVELPAGSRQLETRFAALSFVAPEKVRLRFELRRQGESYLVQDGPARTFQIQSLRPGNYKLHVTAANDDGVWNTAGVTLDLTVAPFFWETPWFLVLVGLVGAGSTTAFLSRRHTNRLRLTEERLRVQETLANERARAAALLQHGSDVILVLNEQGTITYESPSAARILGYPEGHLVGKDPFTFLHQDDLPTARAALQDVLTHGSGSGPVIVRGRDARDRWVPLEALGTNLLQHSGVRGIMLTARDISIRHRADQMMREHARLGHRLGASTNTGEAALAVAEAACTLFGLDACFLKLRPPGQPSGAYILCLDTVNGKLQPVTPSAGIEYTATEKRVMEHGPQLVLRSGQESTPDTVRFGDVQRLSASLMFVPLRHQDRYLGLFSIQSYRPQAYTQDDLEMLQTLADYVTGTLERIRAEAALVESQQEFRDLFERSPDAVLVESAAGIVLDANPAACRLQGLTREELVGRPIWDLILTDQEQDARGTFARWLSGELTHADGFACTADGRRVPVAIRGAVIQRGGEPAVLLHVRDITERKEAERALFASEERFRTLVENAPNGVFVQTAGRFRYLNHAALRLFRAASLDVLRNQASLERFAGRSRATMQENFAQLERESCPIELAEEQCLSLDGAVFDVELSAVPFVYDGQRSALVFFQEVTARKRLEAQLWQVQKMEAIGQLAGGVAHDFNNILAAILMHVGLLQLNPALDEATRLSLGELEQEAERATTLTQRLLAFSRRSVLKVKPLDVNEIVAGLLKMLTRLLGETIQLRFDGLSPLPMVEADSGLLEQVLMNLVVNARDAMPSGGQITLATRVVHFTNNSAAQTGKRRGRFVCLSVTDTGCGMSPETLKHIFEPFFTTKEVGKGTGLGLATVDGIVAQHKGWVEVTSEQGRGTTFHVFLPATEEPAKAPAPAAAPAPLMRGQETILLVEDEPAVLQQLASALSTLGYQVLSARHGREALQVWDTHGGRVSLLFTDMVLPEGMTGLELCGRLRALRPGLKAIISSGYSTELVLAGSPAKEGIVYLPKPFDIKHLAAMVRECLDSKS